MGGLGTYVTCQISEFLFFLSFLKIYIDSPVECGRTDEVMNIEHIYTLATTEEYTYAAYFISLSDCLVLCYGPIVA